MQQGRVRSRLPLEGEVTAAPFVITQEPDRCAPVSRPRAPTWLREWASNDTLSDGGQETGAEQQVLEGRAKLLQAHLGDMHDQFHHCRRIRLIKPRHNEPVIFLRFGASAGFPEKIGSGLPRLEDFPVLLGMLRRDPGVQLNRLIQPALGGTDVGKAVQRFGAPVILIGILPEKAFVAGRRFVQQPLALGSRGDGGWEMVIAGGRFEEHFGAVGGGGVGSGGAAGGED